MRIKVFATVVALGLAVLASPAFAESGSLKLDAVRSQQAEIRMGVESRTGIYQSMSESDRDVLLSKQTQMLRVIGDKQSASDLNEAQKNDVFNSLEQIEALINKTDDERMVCKMSKRIGSNMKDRVCLTVAQMREQEEAAHSQIDRHGIDSFIQGN